MESEEKTGKKANNLAGDEDEQVCQVSPPAVSPIQKMVGFFLFLLFASAAGYVIFYHESLMDFVVGFVLLLAGVFLTGRILGFWAKG